MLADRGKDSQSVCGDLRGLPEALAFRGNSQGLGGGHRLMGRDSPGIVSSYKHLLCSPKSLSSTPPLDTLMIPCSVVADCDRLVRCPIHSCARGKNECEKAKYGSNWLASRFQKTPIQTSHFKISSRLLSDGGESF